jgi:D-alanyl-D-alanine carboxypeptidase/D-alanyl-D-alanine-endopeptidase (penicillin-binding protein 4)
MTVSSLYNRTRAVLAGLLLALAAASTRADAITARIDDALRLEQNDHSVWGAVVLELPSGRTVYASGAHQLLKPASNMKLLTTAAAIDILGPDFQFRTECRVDGDDLVVIGGGDPILGLPSRLPSNNGERALEPLYAWADHLLVQGISSIDGDLIVDDSIFDTEWTNPTWPGEQLQEHYCAPVGGLNVHGNCISARVTPADHTGDPANYILIPGNPWIRIENRCRTGGSGQPWMSRLDSGAGFLLAGKCSEPVTLGRLAVRDPGLFFGTTLRACLAAKGIRIGGCVRRAEARAEHASESPAATPPYPSAVHTTPLAAVLKQANTYSLNLAAEALLKTTGLHSLPPDVRRESRGSWRSGRAAVRSFLGRIGLDDPRLVLADGSGLSHDNRLTPELLAQLLAYMFSSPYRDLYMDSLARSGLEGTLRKRMRDLPGRFLGKTGYIDGVRALSGYLQTDDGTWLAVSFIHNGFNGPSTKYRQAQEQVCRILTAYRRQRASR